MQEDPNKVTYFAATDSRGKSQPFGIKRKDRARHMYVIGKTGMGKSTMLENMAIQDIRNGEGIAFIDPHGSTADKLLEYVPEHRVKDVVYFAPFDMNYPVAFNVMEDVGYDKRHLVVSGLMSAFKKLWVDSFSARMEYILSNTLLALLEYPDSTLLDVNRMLIVKNFRKKVVEHITDPMVRSFWVDEFANYSDRYTQEATPAIQNKIGQFTSNPVIRNIVGQPKSSFDIRKMMDERKIMIINLSKGRVGEGNAALLGSMLVTKIYLGAMSRADLNSSLLKDVPSFYFYVDEFQSFANQSFADILSEARKYKLNLIIAHQYIEQMEEEVRDAVFGNVGTTAVFRVGPFDAEVLETIFKPKFEMADLVNLGFAQIYLTLMIDGVGSPPFSATTLPPFDPAPQQFVDLVIANSRKIYGAPRDVVEKEIDDWQTRANEPPPSDIEKERVKKEARDERRAERALTGEPPPPPTPPASGIRRTSTPGASAPRPVAPAATARPASVPTPRTDAPAPRLPMPRPPVVAAAPRPPILAPRPTPAAKPAPQPVGPRPQPAVAPRPPLEGSTSLKDALARLKSPANTPDPLKETLGKIAPQAAVHKPVQPVPVPISHPAPTGAHSAPDAERVPAQLPDNVLRKMIAVDEYENE